MATLSWTASWPLIGTLAFGFAVLMVIYAVQLLFVVASSRRWISVPAQLVKADVKYRKLEDRTLRGEKLIREIPSAIHAEYKYESAGQQLHGRAINLMDVVVRGFSLDRRDIDELRGLGERIDIWIDPKRPARAVMFRRLPVSGLVALALLLCSSAAIAVVTIEAIVSTYGSLPTATIAAVLLAAILHPIVRGLASLTAHRA